MKTRNKTFGATTMGRKKQTPEPSKRITVLTVKGSPEWAKWLREVGDEFRTPIATLVDQALAEFAKNHGFSKGLPPKR